MSGTNGEAMGMGGEAYKPKPSPDMDLGLMNSLADAADHYAFGQLFEWQEAEFDIVRAKIFLGENSEEGREVIDSRRRQIAQILGRQAAAKAYADGLRERIRTQTFGGGSYYGRHQVEDTHATTEPERPPDAGSPFGPKNTEENPPVQTPKPEPQSRPTSDFEPKPQPEPRPRPASKPRKEEPHKPAAPTPESNPDQKTQPESDTKESTPDGKRRRRRIIITRRSKPTIITQRRKPEPHPAPTETKAKAKTEVETVPEPSVPVPVMTKEPPTQPAPTREKQIVKKEAKKSPLEKLRHAWYSGMAAVHGYFTDPEKGRRRRLVMAGTVVVGGAAVVGALAWANGYRPDWCGHGQPACPPQAAPPPETFSTPPPETFTPIPDSFKPPHGTGLYFDSLQPHDYHGEQYEWSAIANTHGASEATPYSLGLIDKACSNGLCVDTWGDPNSGDWGVNSVTVQLSDGTPKSYYDTPSKLAIIQQFASGTGI